MNFLFPVANFFFLMYFVNGRKNGRTATAKYYAAKGINCEEHFPNKSTLCISFNPLLQEYFHRCFSRRASPHWCWAGDKAWPHTRLATLTLRLVKAWAILIIFICMMKFVGAQQVILKKPMHSSRQLIFSSQHWRRTEISKIVQR